ncbi:MAG: hypothetical protein R3B81_17030 [bacterium]
MLGLLSLLPLAAAVAAVEPAARSGSPVDELGISIWSEPWVNWDSDPSEYRTLKLYARCSGDLYSRLEFTFTYPRGALEVVEVTPIYPTLTISGTLPDVVFDFGSPMEPNPYPGVELAEITVHNLDPDVPATICIENRVAIPPFGDPRTFLVEGWNHLDPAEICYERCIIYPVERESWARVRSRYR